MMQHGTANPDTPSIPFEPFGHARRDGVEIEKPSDFLKKRLPQLHKWLVELLHYEDINSYITLRDFTEKDEPVHVSLSIWSPKYEFVISAHAPSGKMVERHLRGRKGKPQRMRDPGYLGAGMVARTPYAGEQHRRGNDLHDGDFNEETWKGIVKDVLLHSLEMLHEAALNRLRPSRHRRRRRVTRRRRRLARGKR